ncbi:hypothetical protein [Emticicia sp. TH156]|uniref:hypothetical protein n=1 Tax=Emticicia sp. TH156 TaxID=2067454 RepID=UPI000C7936B0|nr:hypothetical protein [Emticicia sp. TH156]PLK45782.1 hypothetical protein C0V77_00025 [Emticicia sp. TH156]
MKTLVKKHLLWGFALLLSVATMSFKLSEKQRMTKSAGTTTLRWHFIPNTSGGESVADNYEPAGSIPDCPNSTSVRCIIMAPEGDPGKPDLSGTVQVLNYKF